MAFWLFPKYIIYFYTPPVRIFSVNLLNFLKEYLLFHTKKIPNRERETFQCYLVQWYNLVIGDLVLFFFLSVIFSLLFPFSSLSQVDWISSTSYISKQPNLQTVKRNFSFLCSFFRVRLRTLLEVFRHLFLSHWPELYLMSFPSIGERTVDLNQSSFTHCGWGETLSS